MEKLLPDDWEKLKVTKDGDCFMVAGPDFVNLQVSPAVFIKPGTPQHDVLSEWFPVSSCPICHLTWFDLAYIIERLNKQEAPHA